MLDNRNVGWFRVVFDFTKNPIANHPPTNWFWFGVDAASFICGSVCQRHRSSRVEFVCLIIKLGKATNDDGPVFILAAVAALAVVSCSCVCVCVRHCGMFCNAEALLATYTKEGTHVFTFRGRVERSVLLDNWMEEEILCHPVRTLEIN